MSELHVVFGARGPLGQAIVRQLVEAGVPVRAVLREDEEAHCAVPSHVEVFHADPVHRRQAIAAAQGATVVYRCINIALAQWTELWMPITENIIAAAHEAGAKLVCPGNIYVYGPLRQVPAREDHPLAAVGEKGRLRIATQAVLFRAHESGAVKAVVPRFPDLYGPCVTTRFLVQIFHHAVSGGPVSWFGHLDAARDFLFVNDAARACIALGGRDDSFGQVWHVPGPSPLTPREFIEQVFEAAGHHPRVKRVSPLSMRIESLFSPETRAFLEFRYRFEQAQVLDGTKFATAFPEFRYTPHQEAIELTLDWFAHHYIP